MARSDCDNSIGLLVSGGLDSCILMSELLRQGRSVHPIFIRSQLIWERIELRALRRYLEHQRTPALRELVLLDLPLSDLYGAHWSVTGQGTPACSSAEKAVYLPCRNVLLTVKADVWCHLNCIPELALATLATSPFADASPQFAARSQAVFNCYAHAADSVGIVLPFAELDKRQVMQLGQQYPLELTFSCIAPHGGRHCGRCNKCAERQRAFRDSGRPDRTRYRCTAM
jgi:7-cyano-7-deazaguanine synthase